LKYQNESFGVEVFCKKFQRYAIFLNFDFLMFIFNFLSPTAFGHAGNQSLIGRFAEAYPAQSELSHIAMLSAATETPPHHA
jgi:hypothetical protein